MEVNVLDFLQVKVTRRIPWTAHNETVFVPLRERPRSEQWEALRELARELLLPACGDAPRLQAWLSEVQAVTHEDAQRVRQWLEAAMSLEPFSRREEMTLPDEQPAPCLQKPAPSPLLADTTEFDEAVARAVKRAQRRGFL